MASDNLLSKYAYDILRKTADVENEYAGLMTNWF